VLVGRVPAVVAVVQWESRVRVLNLWLWLCPFRRCLIIVSIRALRPMQTKKGRVEDQKEGNGSVHTVLCALGRLKFFEFVYIRNNFIILKQKGTNERSMLTPKIIMDTPPRFGLIHN
jgi:hypothetical protein